MGGPAIVRLGLPPTPFSHLWEGETRLGVRSAITI